MTIRLRRCIPKDRSWSFIFDGFCTCGCAAYDDIIGTLWRHRFEDKHVVATEAAKFALLWKSPRK